VPGGDAVARPGSLCWTVAAVALFLAPAAAAHSGHPQVEVSTDHLAAGSGLTVRGVDFDYDSTVRVSLLRGDRPIAIGAATADGRGDFLETFILPVALRAASYRVLAVSSHHSVVGASLAVTGARPASAPDDSRRGQDESLLGSVSTAPQPAQTNVLRLDEPRPDTQGTSWRWIAALAAGSCAVGAAVVFAVRRRREYSAV
jgi:hypothetical protein